MHHFDKVDLAFELFNSVAWGTRFLIEGSRVRIPASLPLPNLLCWYRCPVGTMHFSNEESATAKKL